MLYIKPDYYDDFQCVAGDCEDTCCAGWQIMVDPESLKRYRQEKGPYRKSLHRGIRWFHKVFRQDKNKRCAFLNEENLCDMYTALGHDSLCLTCRRYPRHIEEFEGVRDMTLSVSCPEVAKYLMARTSPVTMEYVETEEEESCADYAEMNFDVLLYDLLEEGRRLMISILQNRSLSLKERCERILHLAGDMENLLEEGRSFECYDLFADYEKGNISYKKKKLRRAMAFSSHVLSKLFLLERLRENWEDLLYESAGILILGGEELYKERDEEFIFWQKECEFSLDIPMEQLLVYFIMNYFCGSVYDGKILAKVQSAVLSTYVIRELCKARFLKNEGCFDQEDLSEIVYRFSRELEHSDKNLDRMEDMASAILPVE